MSDPSSSPPDVIIHEADHGLRDRIGVKNMDQILSPQHIRIAETVINQSAESFRQESLTRLGELERIARFLRQKPEDNALWRGVIDQAFSIKAQAGLGGYYLAADVAKSLQLLAEKFCQQIFAERRLDIIDWHVRTIRLLLGQAYKGDGGAAGAEIKAHLEQLAAKAS